VFQVHSKISKMKSSKFKIQRLGYILATALFAFVIVGCDKVDAPYKETQNATPPDTTKPTTNSDTDYVFDATRKILVEDYTGHQCGNCPKAAEKLEELIGIYGNKVVPLAVHAGFFADIAAAPFTKDFKTSVGNELDTYFGNSVAGNPNGMVNRKGFPNSHIQNLNSWNGLLSPITTTNPDIVLAIKNKYDAATNVVETKIYTKFKSSLTGNYKLCVYLTEDSIIDAQTDYRLTPDDVNPNYLFEHVLRASFNSTWGETIATDPFASEINVLRNKYSMSLSGKLFNLSHPCNVVAFIYNDITKEVIQASMQKIK